MKDADFDAMLKEMLNPEKDYISDDGFTKGVLEKLPSAAPTRMLRNVVLTIFAAVAAGFVLFVSPGFSVVSNAVIESANALTSLHMPSLVSLAVIGIFIWGALVPVLSAVRRPF